VNILAIDTSHPRGSAAILVGGRVESVRLSSGSSHLVELGKGLAQLVSTAGVALRDIDRVAIVLGPGSFTGLRVGMAYLKGLYAARPFEVVVMTSLELLARRVLEEGCAASPMIDARKNEVYSALYRRGPSSDLTAIIAPCVVSPAKHIASVPVGPTIFVGSGALRYRPAIEDAFGSQARFPEDGCHEPDTSLLCRLAEKIEPLAPEDIVTLEPLYVRPDGATLNPLRGVSAYERD
jgi:tRNA threonylcarbamoyladenosine biosynthesis protein TsaB